MEGIHFINVSDCWIISLLLQVNMLNVVTANFLGDNLQCWMQIQTGKGPWSSEVSGIVKIGQTMTMVLGIKDEENKFDMVVSKYCWILIHKKWINLCVASGPELCCP